MLSSVNPTETNAWKTLQKHFEENKNTHIKTLFANDSQRAEKFTIKWEDFLVDYSKNRVDEKTISLLLDLAKESDLKNAIQKYFEGDLINATEGRAVLHTALRAKADSTVLVDGVNVIPEINEVKGKNKSIFKRSYIG